MIIYSTRQNKRLFLKSLLFLAEGILEAKKMRQNW